MALKMAGPMVQMKAVHLVSWMVVMKVAWLDEMKAAQMAP